MATPTGTKGHGVATPQSQPHLPNFTSPAPRSMPSPAAQRQAGKSPLPTTTSAALPSAASTATAQNHPTAGSSGSAPKMLLGSSPAAAMVNFESPMGMSFSLSQMGGVDGGVPMVPGMSGGMSGLGLLSLHGMSDEDRWRKLQEVMEKLESRPGRVSMSNIHLICERLGLGWDLNRLRKHVDLAGTNFLMSIDFDAEEHATGVTIDFMSSSNHMEETSASISAVLMQGLTPPPGRSHLVHQLDAFAANLQKLAKIDRPTGTSLAGFNGFEAISGVYTSLRKIYEHEKKLATKLMQGSDASEKAIVDVTCKRSGRPKMNEDGRLGLDIEYWLPKRHLPPIPESGSSTSSTVDTYSLSIQVDALQPTQMLQPARISDAWISEQIEKPSEDDQEGSGSSLDWLDPPPTYLQPSSDADGAEGATLDNVSATKLPPVRFTAKLKPPLLIPSDLATHAGINGDFGLQVLPSYITALLLYQNTAEAAASASQLPPKEIYANRLTTTGPNQSGSVKHEHTLRIRTYDTAVLLNEIPFDHPKQLIELLPLLRQFALLNNLLKTSYANATSTRPRRPRTPLLKTPTPPSSVVDLTLTTSPVPKLTFTFARSDTSPANPSTSNPKTTSLDTLLSSEKEDATDANGPISVEVSILPNAEIVVGAINARPGEGEELRRKMAWGLDRVEDVDVWVEWVKQLRA